MSNCIKDLYDYEIVKQCYRCKNILLKSNFHKDNKRKDGLHNQCMVCRKEYYIKNSIKLIQKQKDYYSENRDSELERCRKYKILNREKINLYSKNKYKSDINFQLMRKTRSRIYKALQRKSKSSSTKEILGIDVETYKKWIEWQMTPEMKWSNIEIDHVKPICMFDITKDEELKEAFNWRNTQPLLKKDHQQKGIKFNVLDYQNQFIKTYQFLELNAQEGLN